MHAAVSPTASQRPIIPNKPCMPCNLPCMHRGFCCADSMFLHAVTSQTNGVPVTIRSSPTTFVKCDFSGHVSPPNGPVIYAETGAPVWVQESTFDNNTADYKFGSRGGAQFFNDDDLDVEFGGGVTEPARPLSEAGDEIKLLAWTEQFISDIEPVCRCCRAACMHTPPHPLHLMRSLSTLGSACFVRPCLSDAMRGALP